MAGPKGRAELPIEQLRAAVDYDPDTGIFTRRYDAGMPARWNTRWAAKPAGTTNTLGYCVLQISKRLVLAHRAAWALTMGVWPADTIDHISGDRGDNRIVNLRAATQGENLRNRTKTKASTTGFKGVSLNKRTGRFVANIGIGGKLVYLGHFRTAEAAHAAYCAAAVSLHREFART